MAQWLAVEWDPREIRVAVASGTAWSVTMEQAFAIPLQSTDPGETFSDPDIAARLAAGLEQRGIQPGETLVAVGRASIELRTLTLPPAPDDELPEMVRFQGQRQFTSLGEDAVIDFAPIGDDPRTPRKVLAAGLAPRLLTDVAKTCDAAGLTPVRIALRPFATAALVQHALAKEADATTAIIVDLLPEEADLTVLDRGEVAFVRTVRLPGAAGSDHQREALISELRRTVAAATNQLGGRRIDQVLLCGGPEEHDAARQAIEQRLNLVTRRLDPFAGLTLGVQLADDLPAERGGFASLLGMLLQEAAGERPAIDFLAPRKKPESPNRIRQYVLAGVALALLIFGGGGVWLIQQLRSLENEARALATQAGQYETQAKKLEREVKRLQEVEDWLAANVNWLDELVYLSDTDHFPPAEEAIATKLTVASVADRDEPGGLLLIEGVVVSSEVSSRTDSTLQDERHAIENLGDKIRSDGDAYAWEFRKRVRIAGQPRLKPPERDPDEAAAANGPAREGASS